MNTTMLHNSSLTFEGIYMLIRNELPTEEKCFNEWRFIVELKYRFQFAHFTVLNGCTPELAEQVATFPHLKNTPNA